MRKGILGLTAATAAVLISVTACGSSKSSSSSSSSAKAGKKAKIGVILPDSKSSARWETADRPALTAAFKAAGVQYDIQNAQGDKTAFQTIADQMITNGATVLMIVNLDDETGAAVEKKAAGQGVATVDYDRISLGGSAPYYVSFDNTQVGKLQGQGLVKCLADLKASKPIIAQLNGSPTDNNATLFKKGYDGILDPMFGSGQYVKGPDQSVPDWDNVQGGTIFEQMLTSQPKIAGVLAANDGLGNAAIAVLKKNKLNGKVPVTGQDATVQGLQNILAGDQCMTVFKDAKKEAAAASQLAIALAQGKKPSVPQTTHDPKGNRDVPSILLTPESITKDNINDVISAGGAAKAEVCAGSFAALCTKAGIQ